MFYCSCKSTIYVILKINLYHILQVKYLATFLSWIAALLNLLPLWLKEAIVSCKVSKSSSCFQAVLDFLNRVCVANVCFMGFTELEEVNDPDIVSLKQFANKIRFYNGSNDPWCPLEYPNNLKEKIPELEIEICQKNIPHAFVLGRSEDMANIIYNWYKDDILVM